MQPRKLCYLRIEDQVPKNPIADLFQRLPIDYRPLSKWLEFTWLLSNQKVPEFEILTADFNFETDATSPKLDDPRNPLVAQAPNLRWHPDLQRMLTSGILMASTLAGMTVRRDLPAGAAVHTSYKDIVAQDVVSTMLVSQILLLCGEKLNTETTGDLLSQTIATVLKGANNVESAFVEAYARFRNALLERCGIGVANSAPISIWVVWESLARLLDLCDRYARIRGTCSEGALNKQLIKELDEFGLEIYDRRGRNDSIHVASLFADFVLQPATGYTAEDWFMLNILAPARKGAVGGEGWRYLKELQTQSVYDVRPLRAYFSLPANTERKSVMKALEHPLHRMLALYWAWLEQFEENYVNRKNTPFDPIEGCYAPTESFASLKLQCATLLDVIQQIPKLHPEWTKTQPKDTAIPLRAQNGPSILKAIEIACNREHNPNPLTAPLRYGKPEYSQRRVTGVEALLAILIDWGALELIGTRRYRVNRDSLGDDYPILVDQGELAWRLGFSDLSQLSRDILRPGGVDSTTAVFLKDLELRPIPEHYRTIMLGEFVSPQWWDSQKGDWKIPPASWPRCIRPAVTSPHPDLLQEQHFRSRASEQMIQIVSPTYNSKLAGAEIAGCSTPFHLVNGDYYRIWPDLEQPGLCRMIILDASGKHQAAAQLICEVHGFLKGSAAYALEPVDIAHQLNHCLGHVDLADNDADVPTPCFRNFAPWRTATMIAGSLQPDLIWRWANAGHPKPILVRASGEVELLGTTDAGLGFYPRATYVEQCCQLKHGDTLFLYSDGLTEELTTFAERDPDQLLVRLASQATQYANEASGIRDCLLDLIQRSRTATHALDDTTLIVMKIPTG